MKALTETKSCIENILLNIDRPHEGLPADLLKHKLEMTAKLLKAIVRDLAKAIKD